jgi:hypothetical protein
VLSLQFLILEVEMFNGGKEAIMFADIKRL